MSDWIPREGEQVALQRITGPALFLGLHKMTASALGALAENVQWSDVVPADGHTDVALASWTVPTGANRGQPATHPVVSFAGGTGKDSVGGFYIRTDTDPPLLLAIGLHPDVAAGGALKPMGEGSRYDVDPSLPVGP
jgi:hypothetical protein